MYLLMTEVINSLIEERHAGSGPRWLMYDMMLGASAGLRYYKERMGFKAYIVNWRWGNAD
jgi:hypothetical protein